MCDGLWCFLLAILQCSRQLAVRGLNVEHAYHRIDDAARVRLSRDMYVFDHEPL